MEKSRYFVVEIDELDKEDRFCTKCFFEKLFKSYVEISEKQFVKMIMPKRKGVLP